MIKRVEIQWLRLKLGSFASNCNYFVIFQNYFSVCIFNLFNMIFNFFSKFFTCHYLTLTPTHPPTHHYFSPLYARHKRPFIHKISMQLFYSVMKSRYLFHCIMSFHAKGAKGFSNLVIPAFLIPVTIAFLILVAQQQATF